MKSQEFISILISRKISTFSLFFQNILLNLFIFIIYLCYFSKILFFIKKLYKLFTIKSYHALFG
ncbi:MAG: hypothetical protein Q8S84_01225 [bacterium]|nr:hypothetical protein [bacterium]